MIHSKTHAALAKASATQRRILHIDGDSFFASCEASLNPFLKGKPVVTGHERGIATSMSVEAKALGVVRGMPVFQIKREFPSVIIVESNYINYGLFAERMYSIVRQYTPLVEEYSIDECFADITDIDGDAEEIARMIQNELSMKLDLGFSVGVAPTKVLAKVASKHMKPRGLTVIKPENIQGFLENLPINKVWGIGPQTTTKMTNMGIRTAKDFVDRSEDWVRANLSAPYVDTWHELRGQSVNKVQTESEDQKSIQHTRMFGFITRDKNIILSELSHHVELACARARRLGLKPRKIYFFLKTAEFRYHRAEVHLNQPSTSPAVIMGAIQVPFKTTFKPNSTYRSCGVTLAGLSEVVQNDLFGEVVKNDKSDKIFKTVDKIDKRYGAGTIYLGSSLSAHKRRKIEPKRHFKILSMGEVV